MNGIPYCYIDNFFTNEETVDILEELFELKNRMIDGAQVGGAKDRHGKSKKYNIALFIDDLYEDRSQSAILDILSRRVFCDELINKLQECHWYFRHVRASNLDNTQICYYDDQQSYESHTDESLVTFLAWFYDGRKAFSGGDMVFENESFLRCEFNRAVFIPRIMEHEVTPVVLPPELRGKGLGRWSISKFINYKGNRT